MPCLTSELSLVITTVLYKRCSGFYFCNPLFLYFFLDFPPSFLHCVCHVWSFSLKTLQVSILLLISFFLNITSFPHYLTVSDYLYLSLKCFNEEKYYYFLCLNHKNLQLMAKPLPPLCPWHTFVMLLWHVYILDISVKIRDGCLQGQTIGLLFSDWIFQSDVNIEQRSCDILECTGCGDLHCDFRMKCSQESDAAHEKINEITDTLNMFTQQTTYNCSDMSGNVVECIQFSCLFLYSHACG